MEFKWNSNGMQTECNSKCKWNAKVYAKAYAKAYVKSYAMPSNIIVLIHVSMICISEEVNKEIV